MFQNPAVDVAIGLSSMFLMLSLLCTIVNEFIATQLRLRAKSLAATLMNLIDDADLRAAFAAHGLVGASRSAAGPPPVLNRVVTATIAAASSRRRVAQDGPPAAQGFPSYLSGRTVALALIGSLDTGTPLPGIPEIRRTVTNLPNSKIKDSLLSALTEAGDDLDKLRTGIATWFDDSMERLSGAYKRQVKLISILVGLGLAIAFNADSINVATALWKDPTLRESVAAVATEKARGEPLINAEGDVDLAKLKKSIGDTANVLKPLPIGWNCIDEKGAKVTGAWTCVETVLHGRWVTAAFGWIITAAALSLGAPFWFDLLQKVVNLRGTGAKPRREDEK